MIPTTGHNRPPPPRQSAHASRAEGILLVDKPPGPTSHDVVAAVRRRFGVPKVGHGGTLDPQATGLLILLLGRATKLSDRFLGSDKVYEGELHLGIATDSQDADGRVVSEADASGVTAEQLEAQMARLTGDIRQTPPMVSAKKIEGIPLYKLARKGQTIAREPRVIHVYAFSLTRFDPPRAAFVVRCSKGTYVRTLAADIGEALGCGAHLCALRRLSCGALKVEDAAPTAAVLAWDHAALEAHLLPMQRFI